MITVLIFCSLLKSQMESDISFVQTKRGKEKVCYGGFYYTKNNSTKNAIYWRCVNRKCPGRLILSPNAKVMKSSEHNHVNSIEKIHVLRAHEKIKEKASSTTLHFLYSHQHSFFISF